MMNFIKISILLILLFFSTIVLAQGYTANKATTDQAKKAETIVLKFDNQLSLTEKQILLFKNKQA